jgi:hypothetical protein
MARLLQTPESITTPFTETVMNNAVRKLHNDLQSLRHARLNHTSDAKNLKTDKKELAKNRTELKLDRKQGDQMHVALNRDQFELTVDVAAKKQELANIDTQRQAVIARYQADGFDPVSNPNPQETAELAALDQVKTLASASCDAQIAQDTSAIAQDNSQILGKRAEIATDNKEIKRDVKLVARDDKRVTNDNKAIGNDRKKALRDLQPAEYHMNLKDTNRVRGELGLKSVNHVIRPAPQTAKTVELAKRYLGRYESDLQRNGVTLPCPTSESCANFVTSMLDKSGAINFRTLGVDDLNNKLRARGWHEVSLRDAKPGDVWICDGAHGEQHTEIVASNSNGRVTLIGSNNHPNPGDQQINYDSGSAYISGSFILAPR